MSNSKRGQIKFKVGKKTMVCHFSNNNLCRYHDETGNSIISDLSSFTSGDIDFRALRAMLWASVSTLETLEDAGNLIDEMGFEAAIDVIGRAAEAAFPDVEGAEDVGNVPQN